MSLSRYARFVGSLPLVLGAVAYLLPLSHLDWISRPYLGPRISLLAPFPDRLEPGSALNNSSIARSISTDEKAAFLKSAKYRMIKPRNVRYRLRQRGIVSSPEPLCCKMTGVRRTFKILRSLLPSIVYRYRPCRGRVRVLLCIPVFAGAIVRLVLSS
jgi:hypothetical protein